MPLKTQNTIMLEPFTKIAGFDGIGYAASRSIIGAIGGYLYPEGKDKEEKSKFYASPVGRRNKQKVTELVSELYAFLNGIISEHADPRQYYFRLWVRMKISKETGEIVDHPHFDVEVFRRIGKIGGTYTEVGGYVLKVVFVGKEGLPVSSRFIKGASEIVRNTGMVDFKPYDAYVSAPKDVRERITKTSPYLIIDDETYEIRVKMDKDMSRVIPYIEEGKEVYEFNNEKDVTLFLTKKITVKPNILDSETAFELVDKEIKEFSPKIIAESKEPEETEDLFSIHSLGIDDLLSSYSKKLGEINGSSLPSDLVKQLNKSKRVLDDLSQKYNELKTRYEVMNQDLGEMKKDRLEGIITDEKFASLKIKRLYAIKNLRTQLVNLQDEATNEVIPELRSFLRRARKIIRGKKKHVKK